MTDLYQYDKISDKSKQFAIDNLNENPSEVNAHIESFRKWVQSMPHLNCPTDAEFLLRFLRVAKFNHRKAEKRLDNFCTGRGSIRGCPEFFQQIEDSIIDEFLDSGIMLPLGQNDNGEVIILAVMKSWNPDEINFQQIFTIVFMISDMIAAQEESQIHGIRLLYDGENVSRKTFIASCQPLYLKKIAEIIEVFNELKITRVQNDFSEIIEGNPGIEEILPTEYGGLAGSVSECAERFKTKFKNYYRNGNPLSSLSVDESKRPQNTTN